MPRDGIVLVDSGAHRAFAGHYWEAYEPRTYISATNLGPMGWAVPAAVGVACARPGKRVVVITGDGCMQMHGIEIAAAARYGLPITYVVLNNGALGNVWLRAHKLGPAAGRADRRFPIMTGRASAGRSALPARRCASRRRSTLPSRKALAAGGPSVIDVKTNKDAPTPVEDFAAEAGHWSYHA